VPDLLTPSTVAHWIQAYGLWMVFLLVAVESMGVPVPGETALISASLYAGTTHQLDIVSVVAAAAAGAIVGDNIGYLLGRTLGLRVLKRYGPHVGLDDTRLMVGQYLFRRHGSMIVFFGRFVALLRALAAVLAGANGMPWPRFLIANALGGIVWAAAFGAGAYGFGEEIKRVTGPASIALLALACVAIATGVTYLRRHEQELVRRARAALYGQPGAA
jgi:membrane protein DedA with SNARE-associated domain